MRVTRKTKSRVRRQSLKAYENFEREKDNSPTVSTYGYGYFTKEKRKKEKEPTFPNVNSRQRKSEKKTRK